MKTEKQLTGQWGEELVAKYYRTLGYHILARNFRCSFGEIDIICSKANVLYSIEVKTRRSLIFGYPEESILPKKEARLMRLTAVFLEKQQRKYKEVRIQVCSVIAIDKKVMLKIYTI